MKVYGNIEKDIIFMVVNDKVLHFGEHLRDLKRDVGIYGSDIIAMAMVATLLNRGADFTSPINERDPFPQDYRGKSFQELLDSGEVSLLADDLNEFKELSL